MNEESCGQLNLLNLEIIFLMIMSLSFLRLEDLYNR